MHTACPYCRPLGAPQCHGFISDLGEYHCTRAAGHEGPHVTCLPTAERHEVHIWQPTIDDTARDLAVHAMELRAIIARVRSHLTPWTEISHDERCDGDNPCPRDVAEEVLALLPS